MSIYGLIKVMEDLDCRYLIHVPILIKELQGIPLSKTNPEDVDTHASDHAYDALKIFNYEQTKNGNPHDRMLRIKEDLYKPADSGFGY